MRGMPEYCDECECMIPTEENVFVRITGQVKRSRDVTFYESVSGVWCEDCYITITPEVPNPHA